MIAPDAARLLGWNGRNLLVYHATLAKPMPFAMPKPPSHVDLLIEARWIIPVDRNETLQNHAVAVHQGRIEALLPAAEARQRYTCTKHVKLDRHILIPGLINLHTHAAMSLMRGLADDLPLMTWLQEHIWPAEGKHMSAEFVLDGTRLALSRTRIRAPFDGVYDERRVELGDYVEPGQSLLSVVEIGRLKVSAQIPQQDVARLAIGQPVRVQLLDGAQLDGTLHFIAAAAEPGTRSFRIEVAVDNPQHLRLAGASATLLIDTGEALAHAVSPALLSLDKEGRPGIKWLSEQQVVQFTPVQLISVSNQTAWVAGLPKRVALITSGQGFVEAGQQVVAREAGQVN